ncbi:MAG: hypothetical protein NVS3B12_05680 [Acidimicrobiales bacterium]
MRGGRIPARMGLACTVALWVSMVACGCAPSTRTPPLPAGTGPPSVVAYGHSFIAGVPDQGPAWPALLAHDLGRPLVDHGHGGDLATGCLSRVGAGRPTPADDDIVVFECDLNDARRYGADARHLRVFERSFRAALARLRHGRVIVVEDPPIPAWGLYRPFNHGSTAALGVHNKVIERNLPAGTRLARVTSWDPTSMVGQDGVHPNDAGEAAIVAAVADVLGRR